VSQDKSLDLLYEIMAKLSTIEYDINELRKQSDQILEEIGKFSVDFHFLDMGQKHVESTLERLEAYQRLQIPDTD
jgi:hypothetical protein